MKDQDLIREVPMVRPAFPEGCGKENCDRYWAANTPIFSYLAHDENFDGKVLVFFSMSSRDSAQWSKPLESDEHFLAYVDSGVQDGNVSISVLLYKQAEKYLVLRRFTYKNAFKHQKIDDEANWEVENEQIPLTVDLANLFQQKEI